MKFHPYGTGKKADLIDCFRKSGVKLPIDYRIWGRSFDGFDLRFIVPMKNIFRDYKTSIGSLFSIWRFSDGRRLMADRAEMIAAAKQKGGAGKAKAAAQKIARKSSETG